MKHFDERDTMFTRLGLLKGTRKYREYYALHPDLQEEDDRVRRNTIQTMARIFRVKPSQLEKRPLAMTLVLKVINAFYDVTGRKMAMDAGRMLNMGTAPEEGDTVIAAMAEPAVRMANQIQSVAERQKVADRKAVVEPLEASRILKALALNYGGDIAGIVRIRDHHHYTHRGNIFGMGGGYGRPIRLNYTHAVVVAAALDKEMVNRAPRKDTQVAAMLGYARSGAATAQLAMYIKSLGYEARTDNFLEYFSPMTPLAAEAGLGQIGRCNMVVNEVLGNRLKIGAVLTSMPLVEDRPVDFGLLEFCGLCRRCARNCPAGAISFGEPQRVNGLYQWPHDGAKCMEMWMTTGTGICMASCPFSQGIDPQAAGRWRGNPEVIQRIVAGSDR